MGSLASARDPTAMLLARINMAKGSGKGGGGGGGGHKIMAGASSAVASMAGLRPGDWYCNKCGELNFSKNDTCRNCASLRSEADDGSLPCMDPAEFLAPYSIEDDKKMEFFKLSKPQQDAVMA